MMKKDKDGNLIIFENSTLDSLTKVHPLVPIFFWTPILFFCFLQAGEQKPISFIILIILGLFFWTLSEYLLHRFLFHFTSKSPLISKWIFIIHGNHHEVPKDRYRAVMPPIPAFIYGLCIWLCLYLATGKTTSFAIMIGVLFGYLIYDYLHFSFHHLDLPYSWWKRLRKLHAIHHVEENIIFGVSSPLWDMIFSTLKRKEKL